MQATATELHTILLAEYGHHPLIPRREPLHELISTMLSHRTTEANEAKAFSQLWERFGSWEAIANAPTAAVAEAIQPANFASAKAPKIQAVLTRIIAEQGRPSIDFLAQLSPAEGLAWLTSLPGVGPKTASLVLLFCFAKPVLPVDTHVHRVSQRVGIIGPNIDANKAHSALLALLPADAGTLFDYHINVLRHGQRICTWSRPKCERCPALRICAYGQAATSAE